jgi:hypothetical protein
MSIVIPTGTPLYSLNVYAGWNFNLHNINQFDGVEIVTFPYDLKLKSAWFFEYFQNKDTGCIIESTGAIFLPDDVLNDAEISDTVYVNSVISAGTDLYGMQGANAMVFSIDYNGFVGIPDKHYKTTQELTILSEKPGVHYAKNYDGWKNGWFGDRFVLNNHEKLEFVKNLRM